MGNDIISEDEESVCAEDPESEGEEELKKCLEAENAPPRKKLRNTADISPILEVAARVGVSERQAIAIANATKESMGIDLEENPSEILGKGKYHDNKVKFLSQLSEEAHPSTNSLFFDGKKTKTLVLEDVEGGSQRKSEETRDHYVVSDPNDQSYVGEFEPKSGSGADIGQGLIDFAEETQGIELDDLEVLGGDGCAVNTGKSNGVFSYVERKLGRPLQRVVCLLHFWEIMLAHFVKLYVGPTTGPTSWASDLGKRIVQLKDPVIGSFKKISCPSFPTIPDHILKVRKTNRPGGCKDASKMDQRYTYRRPII